MGEYEPFVSALVYDAAAKGNRERAQMRLEAIRRFHMLDITDEARIFAEKMLAGHGIPQDYPEDALHIAVAAANSMDMLVTWNIAHLNNPFTRMMVRQIVLNAGYNFPEICSPEELLEASQ